MKFFTIRNIVLILFILFALFLLANTNILEPLSEKRNPDKVLSKNLLLKQPLYDDNKVIKYKEEKNYKYDIEYALDKPWTTGPDGKQSEFARVNKKGVINKNYYCMDHRKKGGKGICFNPPEYKKTCSSLKDPQSDGKFKISCPSGWTVRAQKETINGAETQTHRCYCKYNVVPGNKTLSINNLWNKCMSKWPKRLAYGVYRKDKNGRELRVNEKDLGDGRYRVPNDYPPEWPANYGGVDREQYEQTNYGPWGWLNTYNRYVKEERQVNDPSDKTHMEKMWKCDERTTYNANKFLKLPPFKMKGVHGKVKY